MQATNIQSIVQQTIVGLDIGNGWVKLVSNIGDPIVFQSLAAPRAAIGESLIGGTTDSPIVIDGVAWEAGFLPNRTDHPQAVHKGACLSDAHYALFCEALHRFGADIDVLVVGMTSDQIGDKANRQALKARFEGPHSIRGKEFFVDKVGVFEQPIGTARKFLDLNHQTIGDQTFLIIDIGFGTTDVTRVRVSIDDDGVPSAVTDFSMSEWHAMSQVCETAAYTAGKANGVMIEPMSISRALRGDGRIKKAGDTIDIRPFVHAATATVSQRLAASIKSHLREMDGIDLVLLTGGGAGTFRNELGKHLGRKVDVMANSDLANAEGFVLLAKDHA